MANLDAAGVAGSWGAAAKGAELRQVRRGDRGRRRAKQARGSLPAETRGIGWPVPEFLEVKQRNPTGFLLDLYGQKSLRSREEKSNLNYKNRVTAPQSVPRLGQFSDPEPLEWRGGQVPLRKDPGPLQITYRLPLSQLSEEDMASYRGDRALGKGEESDIWGLLGSGSELTLIPGDPRLTAAASQSRGVWRSDEL